MTNGNAYQTHQNGRSVAEVLNDFKVEVKEFASTRIQMLRAEMSEKISGMKTALPAIVIGAVLLWVALLLFTGAIVCAIALAWGGEPWAYALSFGIVFIFYLAMGGVLVSYGINKMKASGLVPERTIRVLKQDQIWMQTEARTQL